MDTMTQLTGSTNYLAPFFVSNLLMIFSVIFLGFLDKNIGLPNKRSTWKGVKIIFHNINIVIFLFMMFVCGMMFGFIETFLFVFLKEDLDAPLYLLGIAFTTGAVVSIPFMHYSDSLVERIGVVNVFVLALAAYGVRFIGHSFIVHAWLTLPLEVLKVNGTTSGKIVCNSLK